MPSVPSRRMRQKASGSLAPAGNRQLKPMIAIGSRSRPSFACSSSSLSSARFNKARLSLASVALFIKFLFAFAI